MMDGKKWNIITNEMGKKSILDILLKNRGLKTKKQIDDFLNPSFEQILKIKLTDTQKAIARIQMALKNQGKIVVYSDYDADGICAAAIVWETLNDLGADVMPYVPHRIREGYGLSEEVIRDLARKEVSLIITVDHGVTARKQIEEARKLKIDVIVTDHHVLPKTLPKPYALVHSTQLCGAGVAWRFCWDLIAQINPGYQDQLRQKLELAALATIADLVPVLDANRAIVKIGLEKLAYSPRPGLKALVRASGINGSIGTYEIGHILAPRINAMGRIEHGLDSLRLLCVKSTKQAERLAQLLSHTNSRRQDLTTKALAHAMELVEKNSLVGVIAHESWHQGVIGLVAARLVEAHHKPMIVISRGQTYSRGSARSIPGFNIVEAIRSSSEYLVDGGGHPMAAGFTIETRHIETFAEKVNRYAASRLSDDLLTPIINVECELALADINRQTLKQVKALEPYGVGNSAPFFLTRKMMVDDLRTVGAESNHLKLQLDGCSAIGFNMGPMQAYLRPGYLVDVVYSLDKDKFSGQSAVQLKVKDLKVVES